MGLLLKAAFKNNRHRALIIFTLVCMCILTVASKLEVFAFGVMTKKGPEFFELFGDVKDGTLHKVDFVTQDQMMHRWDMIASDNVISREGALEYMKQWNSGDIIQSAVNSIDQVFPISGNVRNLAIFLVCIALFNAVMLFAYRFSTRIVAIKVSRDLRQQYFEHIQSLPMSFYQKYNVGSISSRVVSDALQIAEAINSCLVNYLQTPFNVLTTLVICFMTSWHLSILIFLGFPMIVLPVIWIAKRVKRISKQIQKNQEKFTTVLLEFLSGIQTVKVFSMEAFSLKKYQEHNARMAKLEQKSARYDLSSRPIVHTIGMTFLSGALLYGLYVLHMSVSETIFYAGMLYLLYEPVKKFAEENGNIQRGVAAAERMYEVMAEKSMITDDPNAEELNEFSNSIEFRNVSFRYNDEWVLKDLNFSVEKGKTVAIVGPTGAGKSTIVQLIPRLYDVQEGEILIDGKSIKAYTQKSLRENISFVPQKPFLFLDTIAENISFGRDFSQEQIEAAAKKAHADEFIQQLANGYSTELSETGKNLSGGQQQRLAIARALVKDAPILIMDEATSSLDTVSENYIKTSIQQLHGEVTQIIIAHRLTTIEDADKIIYLEEGQKVSEGTKDELLESCPGFRYMWDMMHKKRVTQKQ